MRALIALGVAAALSACGDSATTASQAPPWPKGPWQAVKLGYFMEACGSSGIDVKVVDSYCVCALKEAMRRNPKPKNPTIAATDAGEEAAMHPHDFPSCVSN